MLKSYGVGGGGGGLEQFSVSPRPLGFGFGAKGLGPGLDNTFINLYGNHIYSSKLSHHCVIALLGDVDELVLVDLLLRRVLGLGQEATAEGLAIAETRPGD